jgi:hypothetical protein
MSVEVLVVVGVLAVLAIIWAVCKLAKAAVVFGLAAAIVYVAAQYAYPFWEAHLAPIAGSFF